MTKQTQQTTEQLLERQLNGLAHIARQLDTLLRYMAPTSPDYRAPLAAYRGYDWASLGAQVMQSDSDGPVAVRWNGHDFIRRSGAGKFGKAIWYSRSTGKNGEETQYARLITFKGDGHTAEKIGFDV